MHLKKDNVLKKAVREHGLYCRFDYVLNRSDEPIRILCILCVMLKLRRLKPMNNKKHIELNVHSNGALNETVITPKEIVAFAERNGSKAVAITDLNSVSGFLELSKAAFDSKTRVKPIFGVRLRCCTSYGVILSVTLLAKNRTGLKNMYRIISSAYSNVKYESVWPCAEWDYVLANREGLLIGNECSWNFIYANRDTDIKELESKMGRQFGEYDYIEITPLDQDRYSEYLSGDKINEMTSAAKTVVGLFQSMGKHPAAVSNAVCITDDDELCWDILHQDDTVPPFKPGYMRTTEEVMEEYSFLGDLAKTVVIDNTNLIADSIERFELAPPPEESRLTFPNAEREIRERCMKAAKDRYGEPLPKLIEERLADELGKIETSNSWSEYLLASRLTDKCTEHGGLHTCSGPANSSLCAYLLGITDTDPLPPHYYCPGCKRVEFADERKYLTGFDLVRYGSEPKLCPECGTAYKGEGVNSPCEMFMGYNGEKEPFFQLLLSEGSVKAVLDRLNELVGKDRIFFRARDGFIGEMDAMISKVRYCNKNALYLYSDKERSQRLYEKLRFVRRSFGTGLRARFIVPENYDVFDFSPVGYPSFEQAAEGGRPFVLLEMMFALSGHRNKLFYIFEGDYQSMLEQLEKHTGVSADSIDTGEVDIRSFFENDSLCGFHLNTPFMKNLFAAVKPEDPADLVKAMGFANGTGTWTDNAEQLIRQGHTAKELISFREDVMLTLMGYGIDRETAYSISEYVRFGRAYRNGFSEEQLGLMKKHGVPEWYIGSMKKILYLWVRSHCAAKLRYILQCIWFKINYPTEFYAAFLSCKVPKDLDLSMLAEGKEHIMQEYGRIKEKAELCLPFEDKHKLNEKRQYLEAVLECSDRGITLINAGKSGSGSVRFMPDNGNIKMYL